MWHCLASIIAPTIFVFLAIESLWTQKCYGPNLQVQTCIFLFFQKVSTLGSQGALRPPMPFGSHYHTQGGWPIAPQIFVVFFSVLQPTYGLV